jgi:anti-sigma factor RsiW
MHTEGPGAESSAPGVPKRAMSADHSEPKRRCKDLVGLLADYVEFHLPPHVHAELERHLARCPRCVAQVKTYQSTVALLSTIKDEDLPEELRWTLKAFVDRNCRN